DCRQHAATGPRARRPLIPTARRGPWRAFAPAPGAGGQRNGKLVIYAAVRPAISAGRRLAVLVSQARDDGPRGARQGSPRTLEGSHALRVRIGAVLSAEMGRGGIPPESATLARGLRGKGPRHQQKGPARSASPHAAVRRLSVRARLGDPPHSRHVGYHR